MSAVSSIPEGGPPERQEEALVRRFSPAVRTYARRRLRRPEAVEEFTQDVMLVFVEALRNGSIDDPTRMGGFVLGICHNLARERARTRDRRAALWAMYGDALTVLETEAPERDRYEVAHLEDCLSQLSLRARDVVRLTYLDELDGKAIATHLATSEANVRVLRHRSLAALRECMGRQISWEAS